MKGSETPQAISITPAEPTRSELYDTYASREQVALRLEYMNEIGAKFSLSLSRLVFSLCIAITILLFIWKVQSDGDSFIFSNKISVLNVACSLAMIAVLLLTGVPFLYNSIVTLCYHREIIPRRKRLWVLASADLVMGFFLWVRKFIITNLPFIWNDQIMSIYLPAALFFYPEYVRPMEPALWMVLRNY